MKFRFLFLLPLLGCAAEFHELSPEDWIIRNLADEKGRQPRTRSSLTPSGINLQADFRYGGNSAGVSCPVPPGGAIETVSLELKTSAKQVFVELIDASGQHHFQTFFPKRNTEFETFTATSFPRSYGGAGDRKIHPPVKTLWVRWLRNPKGEPEKFTTALRNPVLFRKSAKIQTETDPSSFVTEPGGPDAAVKFHFPAPEREIAFRLLDYSGKELRKGTLPLKNENTAFLPVPESPGYYEWHFPGTGFRCGMHVQKEFRGDQDPFFCYDVAFSSSGDFIRNPGLVESCCRLMKRTGIYAIRDRVLWKNALERKQGQLNVNGWNSFLIRKTAARYGLKNLDTFHQCPEWYGGVPPKGTAPGSVYPDRLPETAHAWKQILSAYAVTNDSLEIWNEPEEYTFGRDQPGDRNGALLRTLSHTVKTNNLPLKIVGGVFTGRVTHPELLRTYLDNGLLESSDVMSFHYYGAPGSLPGTIAAFRRAIAATPYAGIPFWITEYFTPWHGPASRAMPSADRTSAAGLVIHSVQARAYGIERCYPFMLRYWGSAKNTFGTLDKNNLPMRSFSAYAVATRFLSHTEYAGEVAVKGAEFAYVFRRGSRAVVVLLDSRMQGSAVPPWNFPVSAFAIDGRPLKQTKQFDLKDGVCYLESSYDSLRPFLKTDTESMKYYRLAKGYRPIVRKPKSLVLLFEAPFDSSCLWSNEGYRFRSPQQIPLKISVQNLDGQAQKVRLNFMDLNRNARVLLPFPNREETVPPYGIRTFQCMLDLSLVLRNGDTKVAIGDAAGSADPLVLWILPWKKRTVIAHNPNRESPPPRNWDELNAREWTVMENWNSMAENAKKLRAAFQVSGNEKTLRCRVLVEDTVFHQPHKIENSWLADSVQLALQRHSPNFRTYTGILAAHTKDGDQLYFNSQENKREALRPQKSKMTFRRISKSLCLYAMDLDAEELGYGKFIPGEELGFSVLVNNSDGKGRSGYLTWGGDLARRRRPVEFNLLKFAGKIRNDSPVPSEHRLPVPEEQGGDAAAEGEREYIYFFL